MNTNPLWVEFMNGMHKMGHIHHAMKWKDITRGEFMVLSIIHKEGEMRAADGENRMPGVSVSALAKIMRTSQPAASRTLKGMEAKNYIVRSVDPGDRRNTYVTMTENGDQRRQEACSYMERISGRVAARMGDEDMRKLISLWDQLADYMQEEIEREKEIEHETDI